MSEPIRIGLVGLGRAGRHMHVPELLTKPDKFKIVAVCDLIKERRDEAAELLGAAAYDSIDELLKDTNVEVVNIATRSCDHYAHAKQALAAGKSVLLEKPMCISYAQAKDLVDYANSLGDHKLYIRHNRRYEGKFSQVYDLVESGIIGDCYLVKTTRNGFDLRNDWQTIDEFGGGQLLNWGPHVVDHAIRFCGGDFVDIKADRRQVNASGNCEDHVKAMITGINGRIVDFELSKSCAIHQPDFIAYGTRGTIADINGKIHLKYLKPGTEKDRLPADPGTPMNGFRSNAKPFEWVEEDLDIRSDEGLMQTWDYLYDDFRNGVPYPITLEQALNVIKAIDEIKKTPLISY